MAHEPALERIADMKEGGGYEATRDLLGSDARPDAIFVANGLMTIGALRCLSEAGIEIRDEDVESEVNQFREFIEKVTPEDFERFEG